MPNESAATESDVRELRGLLKSAQNDVKRYASRVIRLQQELDRERLKEQTHEPATAANEELLTGDNDWKQYPLDQVYEDEDVENIVTQSACVTNQLERLLARAVKRGATHAPCHCASKPHTVGETAYMSILEAIKTLVATQTKQLEEMARENAKLRDELDKRPTHRDLARSQWQIDSLQAQLARSRDKQRNNATAILPPPAASIASPTAAPSGRNDVPVFDGPAATTAIHDSLADRISVDKLLSWLHVKTKRVATSKTNSSRTKSQQLLYRRRFLKEPVECYLVLDAAAMDSSSTTTTQPLTEKDKMEKREQLSRRVGILCSEIVASCCHSLGVDEIASLPKYVEATASFAQLVPFLQDFVHRIDGLTQAAATSSSGQQRKATTSKDEGFLEGLSTRVQDLVFELRARREQMKPPGDTALVTLLRCMKALRVDHMDALCPMVEKLIDSTRCEKEFLRDVRNRLGLDVAAPRSDVLALVGQLLDQVGLSQRVCQARMRASHHRSESNGGARAEM